VHDNFRFFPFPALLNPPGFRRQSLSSVSTTNFWSKSGGAIKDTKSEHSLRQESSSRNSNASKNSSHVPRADSMGVPLKVEKERERERERERAPVSHPTFRGKIARSGITEWSPRAELNSRARIIRAAAQLRSRYGEPREFPPDCTKVGRVPAWSCRWGAKGGVPVPPVIAVAAHRRRGLRPLLETESPRARNARFLPRRRSLPQCRGCRRKCTFRRCP